MRGIVIQINQIWERIIEVYKDKKLVLGFAPTRRRMYSEKPAIENRVIQKEVRIRFDRGIRGIPPDFVPAPFQVI